MKKRNLYRSINRSVLILVVMTAILTASITLIELSKPLEMDYGDGAQSRLDFRWGLLHNIILVIILLISVFLSFGWKRLFPFHVPITILVIGFAYVLLFLTFTVGWVGIQGMLGFVIAFVISMILIIAYTITILIDRKKGDEVDKK